MKIHFILSTLLTVLGVSAQAQSYYKSSGFEQAGVVEYLQFTPKGKVLYWTNKNKRPMQLIKVSETLEGVNTLVKVRFANSTQIYTLEMAPTIGPMICVHPNGKKQTFEYVQTVFMSKNFERQGVTEYLQNGMMGWVYWTSQDPKKTVFLEPKGNYRNAKGYVVEKLSFPKSQSIYQLTFVRNLQVFEVICVHPSGKKQYFTPKGF
jgi:hypothetical protein